MLLPTLLALLPLVQDVDPAPPSILAVWDRGDRIEAVALLEAKVERGRGDAALVSRLVEWEIAIHRYRAAWAHLERLGDEHNSTRGRVLYQLGRYEQALVFLNGRQADQTLARLDALEALGRGSEARAALELAAEVLGPEHPEVRVGRGRFLARDGKHELAAAEFRAALKVDELAQAARFGLGRSLIALGQREQGLQVLAEHRRLVPLIDRLEFAFVSLDLAPAHAPNHAEVGDAERLLGRIDRALDSYLRARELAQSAELAPIALRLARLLFEDRNDLERALVVLEKSMARVSDPRLAVRAGDYLRAADRLRDAERHYEQALELRPKDVAILERLFAVRTEISKRGERER